MARANHVSKIAIATFNALFPVIVATIAASESVDRQLLWSARSLGQRAAITGEIILTAALPQIMMTGLEVALLDWCP